MKRNAADAAGFESENAVSKWLIAHPAITCPDELQLTGGIVGRMVTPGCDPELTQKGLSVVSLSFPGDAVAEDRMRAAYEGIRRGARVDRCGNDAGRIHEDEWEKVCFYVFFRERDAVALGGLYRYLIRPDEYWLARIGVVPALQGNGMGAQIVDRLKRLLLDGGLHELLAFTEASPGNKAHQFYRKEGWTLDGRVIEYGGVRQVVYRCSF